MTISNRLSGPSFSTDSTSAALGATRGLATMQGAQRGDDHAPLVRGWREPVAPIQAEITEEAPTRAMRFGLPAVLAAGIAAAFVLG